MIIIALILIAILLLISLYTKRVINCAELNPRFSQIAKISILTINVSIIIFIISGLAFLNIWSGAYVFIRIAVVEIIIFTIPMIILFILNIPIEVTYFINKQTHVIYRRVLLGTFALLVLYLGFTQIIPDTNYKVNKETIYIESLPKSFDRFKIVQIADIHIGTLSNKEYKALNDELTKICNSLSPDIIALTGDIIHFRPNELIGRREFLARLKASKGKYFIYGNHDTGMYNRNLTDEQKADDIAYLNHTLKTGEFKILNDEVDQIINGTDTLYILGINEYRAGNYFSRYKQIVDTLNENTTIISLAHNPAYYNRIINSVTTKIPELTLAAHTHAMQIEINIFGYSWSPSDAIHKYSRGMYKDGDNHLYVNRGIGYHFYRRIGSRPEITLFELRYLMPGKKQLSHEEKLRIAKVNVINIKKAHDLRIAQIKKRNALREAKSRTGSYSSSRSNISRTERTRTISSRRDLSQAEKLTKSQISKEERLRGAKTRRTIRENEQKIRVAEARKRSDARDKAWDDRVSEAKLRKKHALKAMEARVEQAATIKRREMSKMTRAQQAKITRDRRLAKSREYSIEQKAIARQSFERRTKAADFKRAKAKRASRTGAL